jgi:CMP-N-acetylneuraminic acid synthetase
MAYKENTVLAVIPARGGSKRIPHKNLRKINGVSLVGHAARIAKSLSWIDKIILSTDDERIAEEGQIYGVDVPFMRPSELATDTSTSRAMWKHAWLSAEKKYNMRFNISVLLEPTSPLRIPGDIELTVETLTTNNCSAAATISKIPADNTPPKTLLIREKGYLGSYLNAGFEYNSHNFPDYYCLNGICYAVKRKTLLEAGCIVEEDCLPIIIGRNIVNIDEFIDLELATYFFSKSGKNYNGQ